MDLFVSVASLFENTVSGLIGAGISGAVLLGAKRTKDAVEERKYSIAGEYRAAYEDLVNGENVVQRDMVLLKQSGLKVAGDQHDAEKNRGWRLEGRIDPASGHVYGVYRARAHTDSGIGVFVFEQKSGGILDGLWAGYDSQNRNIESGKYTLHKQAPVSVRPARKKDMGRILEIGAQTLGNDYMNGADFHALQDASDAWIFVAESEGVIQGFALLECLPRGGFAERLKGQSWTLPPDVRQADADGRIGYLRSVGVSPAFQNKGIGCKLVKKAMEQLEKSGARLLFALGWKTDTVHIGPVLLACGFREKTTFEEFWHDESLREGYDCPRCGHPCHCAAVLFIKNV